MIKKRVTASIAVHQVQADIITGLQEDRIDLSKHSLREIATIIGLSESSAQKIKHHLHQLVKLGVISIVDAGYYFEKRM